ncbi:MAG TPA: hypothetical protein VKY29_03975 [Cryomorphaceae bacterium]|nr:hypothetical protein [Cryomorphaceae bacterium]
MIFIFDWGYTTTWKVGPLSRDDVGGRVEDEFVWLTREREWFRAFFIPTIPTRTRYLFVSDGDGQSREIDREEFEYYRPLAELNALMMNDGISSEDYDARRREMGFG